MKNGVVLNNCVKTDLKQTRRYYFASFIIRYAKIKVLFSFNQFVKLLVCILRFCIIG